MRPNLERRSTRARLTLASRILALASFTAAGVVEHWGPVSFSFGVVLGVALIALALRRKAPIVADAVYAVSADLLSDDAPWRRQYPGELSVTSAGLVWMPSRHSLSHGLKPVSIATAECAAIRMQRGAALFDVIVSAQRRGGEETRFLTRRRPGLRRAIARLG